MADQTHSLSILPGADGGLHESSERLNESQRNALDLSCHVALTAAAGSGKTTVLVERYLRILENNGYRPEQIVAITFTEEAAAQLKARIRTAIRQRAGEKDAVAALNWADSLRRLSLSPITTIHGFCLSLLRDYPVEAGLKPDFELLPPAQQELSMIEAVGWVLAEQAGRLDSTLIELLDLLPLGKIRLILLEMLRRRNHLFQQGNFDGDFHQLMDLYETEVALQLSHSELIDCLEGCLHEVPAELLASADSSARRCCRQLDLLERRGQLGPVRFASGLAASLRQRVRPSRRWADWRGHQQLMSVWADLGRWLQQSPLKLPSPSEREDLYFGRALKALRELHRLTLARFRTLKKKAQGVDFDDLLSFSRRLVRLTRVRESLRRRYHYYLIDEFQDTNHLQWEILRPLLGPRTNLFTVGDAKQSIYRFRDADVSVFSEVQRWIRRKGRVEELPENYRSLPALVEFNNQVFGHLFRGGADYEAAHQEMMPRREGQGRIEAFFLDDEPVPEPDLAAVWIRRLLAEGHYLPGDVAILLRARTRLRAYEDSLLRFNVPFETVGGFGFYRRPEVYDLINLLSFLEDPMDDVALLGLLRSPFFNFSDEDLLLLSEEAGTPFWNKLLAADEIPAHWQGARALIGDWLKGAPHSSASKLVRRALADTGYLAIVSSGPRGSQRRGNVLKMLELIRTFGQGGRRGVPEFLRFIDALIKAEVSEAESALATETDCVRIYTIHGAKGLQFPVVLIPELGIPLSWGPHDRFLGLTSRRAGNPATFCALKFWNPDDGYSELSHPAYKALRQLDEFRQTAEEKRLLYVAATRARDRLLLLGHRSPGPSYAKWLIDAGAEDYQVDGKTRSDLLEAASASNEAPLLDSSPEMPKLEELPPVETGKGWIKESWTPTEIATFSRCPRRFFLRYVEAASAGSFQIGGADRTRRLGSAVHKILEEVPDIRRQDALGPQLESWTRRLSALSQDAGEIRSLLARHLDRTARSPFYERMLVATEQYRERSFYVRQGEIAVEGVIDWLFHESAGGWVVVDFKTHPVHSEELILQASRKGFDVQIEIYLWAASRLVSSERLKGVLFFTYTGDLLDVTFDSGLVRRCEDILARLPRRMGSREYFAKTSDETQCQGCPFLVSGECSGSKPAQRQLWSGID